MNLKLSEKQIKEINQAGYDLSEILDKWTDDVQNSLYILFSDDKTIEFEMSPINTEWRN